MFKVGEDDISDIRPETFISSGDKELGTRVRLSDLPLEVFLMYYDQHKNGRKDTVNLIDNEDDEPENIKEGENDSLAEQSIETAFCIINFVPDTFSKLVLATEK